MASDQFLLKEDGYLNIFTESRSAIYHQGLNVILVFNQKNEVKILDVNSGVVLQSCIVSDNSKSVKGRYLQFQDKLLFWDGRNIGLRSDYTGVLLLDTILQAPVEQNDDIIKLEMLLSEAILFHQSIQNLEEHGVECPSDVHNELMEKIKEAQNNNSKRVKAQRWTTICLELPHSSLKLVANNVIVHLKRLERHIPALAIASAINERLTDLLFGLRAIDKYNPGNFQRFLMYSEAARRQTFEKWPHMDYKWALPDQMAQAGFYHEPSEAGEDRALCFTCNVCLVCWEKTDEPWSEHERHSPICPFVKGEYTQNVPLSVTYATNPAIQTAHGFDVISSSEYTHLLCTSNSHSEEITIWSIERQLKMMYTFKISKYINMILLEMKMNGEDDDSTKKKMNVNAICALPNVINKQQQKQQQSGGTSSSTKWKTSPAISLLGSKFIVGVSLEEENEIDESNKKKKDDLYLIMFTIIDDDNTSSNSSNDEQNNKSNNKSNSSNTKNIESIPKSSIQDISKTIGTTEKGSIPGQFTKKDEGGLDNIEDSPIEVSSSDNLSTEKFNMDDSSYIDIFNMCENPYSENMELTNNIEDELLKFDGIKNKIIMDTIYYPTETSSHQQSKTQTDDNLKTTKIATKTESLTLTSKSTENDLMKPSVEIDVLPINCVPIKLSILESKTRCDDGEYRIKEILAVAKNQILVHLQLMEKNLKKCNINDTTVKMEIDDDNENFKNNITSIFLIYTFDEINGIINPVPLSYREFSKEKEPKEICVLPFMTNNHKKDEKSFHYFDNNYGGIVCLVCSDGSLELIAVNDLKTISVAKRENEKFVSATFCKSVERICGCTEKGCLIFFSFHDEIPDEVIMNSIDFLIDETSSAMATVTGAASLSTGSDNQQKMAIDMCEIDGSGVSTSNQDPRINNQLKSQFRLSPNLIITSEVGGAIGSENSRTSPIPSLLAQKSELTLNDLKTLYSLTLFEDELTPYTAEVPSCWNELIQAQKQRRNPHNLRSMDDSHYAKTWRLHNDATTWDEHIIELTLQKPPSSSLGHIDLKFSLYQQCPNPPAIQVTLLKQNTYGFGYRMKQPNSSSSVYQGEDAYVDDQIEFPLSSNEGTNENPVLCDEYLQAHKAEILAGPIELSSCMDLCDQGGLVTLTSPKLFKTRAKNFLLHIKTMIDPVKEGRSKTRVPIKKRGIMRCLFSSFTNNSSENMTNNVFNSNSCGTKQSRNDYYVGCDWLHEISIAVRSTKENSNIPNEKAQRIAMLESNNLIESLLKIITNPNSLKLQKNLALDILIWICSIRLMRLRSPKVQIFGRFKQQHQQQSNENSPQKYTISSESPTVDMKIQQKECVSIIEQYLESIIYQCTLRGNRNISHKSVKLILLVAEGVRNLPQSIHSKVTFDVSLKNAINTCIPKVHEAKFSSAIRWFSLLVCAVASPDSHQIISDACITLLTDVTKEMETRWNPYCSILNARFGLYGSPFEPTLFDTELPQLKSRNSNSPNTLVNIIKSNSGSTQQSQSSWMDFKKLSSIDGTEFRSFPHLIKAKSINNQIRGLLEVEPLHFTCFATSEATRIETVDSLSSLSTTTSNINIEDLILTPPQNTAADIITQSIKKHMDQNEIMECDIVNNVKNMLVDKLKTEKMITIKTKNKNYTTNDDDDEKLKPNGFVEDLENTPGKTIKYSLPKFKAICKYIKSYDNIISGIGTATLAKATETTGISANELKYDLKMKKSKDKVTSTAAASATTVTNNPGPEAGNINEDNQAIPWHKLLVPPPKQMVIIDRISSGARRFVVIDFGQPIVLTDLVIPACEELSSLFIDIWCYDEEKDSIRLVSTQDIGAKTLVLSDIQPAPICRYMKITIVGRYGMSGTKCKFPIGSFYGHLIVLDSDIYADNALKCMKASSTNISTQIKTLNSLYEDVSCRHNLSCNKLIELLKPLLKGELSNLAHMQAFVSKQQQKDELSSVENNKITTLYEECITLQHQMNLIRSVIYRLEDSINPKFNNQDKFITLQSVSKDKLRVLSECLVEILLHLSTEYGLKNIFSLHSHFTMDVANRLFNTLVVCGDAYIQLATCSLLVRMCCFQSWWGDFVANIFCNLFSSQNTKVFPQDRIFFLLTYLGRRSIAMGSCRSIIIDAILKTIAKLLAPISSRYDRNVIIITDSEGDGSNTNTGCNTNNDGTGGAGENDITNNLWMKIDLQLITWLNLFLSICLDENSNDKKEKTTNRWEFMSCETDFSKSRQQSGVNNGKTFPRCFKKRNIQQTKYNGLQPYTDWGKKIYMLQNELPEIFMELAGKTKASKPTNSSATTTSSSNKPSVSSTATASASSSTSSIPSASGSSQKITKQVSFAVPEPVDNNSFNSGLRSIKLTNIIVVIRGLISLILEMDFTVNMDLFLLTCKVVARLISACRPSIQLSKIITTQQLEQLVRLAVWNDQQQPWTVHAITCLLQDSLDADKNYKESFETIESNDRYGEGSSSQMEGVIEAAEEIPEAGGANDNETSQIHQTPYVVKEISYADTVRYGQLPSLIECEDNEIDELLNELDNLDRCGGGGVGISNSNANFITSNHCPTKLYRRDSHNGIASGGNNATVYNKNSLNFFCKGVSSALDSRLSCGLDTNIQILIRRLTMMSSLDLYASLPQVPSTDIINTSSEQIAAWPEYVISVWLGPEYNCGLRTYEMFKSVFDNIFADLHLNDTWVHLQQVLQIWLTLNSELSEKPYNSNVNYLNNIPKIPLGSNAVEGLLLALAWHNDVKLHTWCLGFQCLILACNIHSNLDKNADFTYDQKIGHVIIMDENFERMLLRFLSGHGMNSPMAANRCVGPTICKYLHELLLWLQMKAEFADHNSNVKRKLKNTLLNIILQLTQPGGAIYNQQGPIDAQGQLIRDLISIQYDKADLTIAMNIIENVSFLVYNNIANAEKVQCRRMADFNNSNNSFGSLFATVLGADNSKQNIQVSDNSLIISLLKLCASLVQTELECHVDEFNITSGGGGMENESQTDEIKAEQLNNEQKKKGGSYVVDQVLQHFPTMKRLLSTLSHCTSSSFTMLAPSTTAAAYSMKSGTSDLMSFSFNEPQTTADAVFHLLMLLCEKASHPKLIVTPVFNYIEMSSSQLKVLPRLMLSEPLLWYILKVLDTPSTVSIFNELGGIRLICQNLVQCKRFLINTDPGLISLIMQHITRYSSLNEFTNQSGPSTSHSSNSSKKSSQQANKSLQERLFNFAPFCSVTSENTTAQPANALLQTPVTPHRRARTPAWNYMFYPNESHVDLTIHLPTAILLSEIQIQPHVPTLATCPSAVAIEISKGNGLGPIPFGQALMTAGMTLIRLKLSRPEIATSVILRLYRPKDNSNIGLNQISVLGTTIFRNSNNRLGTGINGSPVFDYDDSVNFSEDPLAKTSIGWIRILARCFSVATFNPDSDISKSVISSAINYPGFLESCCCLMNILPSLSLSNMTVQNLETVLFKLGEYSKDMLLSVIKTLIYDSVPQAYRLYNDGVCDVLYELCTRKDNFVLEKINVLLNWIIKLNENYGNGGNQTHFPSLSTMRVQQRFTNPQCGFIKCMASILWNIYTENNSSFIVPNNLSEMTIIHEAFESCIYWIEILEENEPLKAAFDSLLCSLCCIRPDLFNVLLKRFGVITVANHSTNNFENLTAMMDQPSSSTATTATTEGITDDNKGESGSKWFKNVAAQNLSKLLGKTSYLDTLAAACQSPLAVYQLVDSGLPKMLSYALYEFCCSYFLSVSSAPLSKTKANENSKFVQPSTSSSCLTDSDKVENNIEMMMIDSSFNVDVTTSSDYYSSSSGPSSSILTSPSCSSLINIHHVPKLLDFFVECCSEGYMRDWLGSNQGSIFWKPLLELLINYQPSSLSSNNFEVEESIQQAFINIERSTIDFLSKVTTCHPKNQETLMSILIIVINQPPRPIPSPPLQKQNDHLNNINNNNKLIISGFTRRLILQLLLESERILISVHSKMSMHRKEYHNINMMANSMSNHPSKRIDNHHLLFYLNTNTTCQEILQNCTSVYNNIIPPLNENNQLKQQSECINPMRVENCSSNFGPGNGISSMMNTSEKEIYEFGFANMEFLSVAAGVTAKDKRLKDVKNHAAALKDKEMFPKFSNILCCSTPKDDILLNPLSNGMNSATNFVELIHPDCPDIMLTSDTTISQILAMLYNRGFSLSAPCLQLNLVPGNKDHNELITTINDTRIKCSNIEPLASPLQKFSSRGGLLLLAHYLPTVYPDYCTLKSSSVLNQNQHNDKEKSPPANDWVKIDANDDVYEDLEETLTETTSQSKVPPITSVPQHSLAAFGLFLRLPAYSDVLLRDKIKAQCLLRLVLGVTGDGEGNDIYSLSIASTLPTLPFEVFRQLLDNSPLTTDDGLLLRRMTIDVGAMHLILNYLGIFTHQSQSYQLAGPQVEFTNGVKSVTTNKDDNQLISDDKSHVYWAKGTGFGTGSTQKSWDVEQALMRQKSEEEHVTVLLQVLSSYINPGDRIPKALKCDDETLKANTKETGDKNDDDEDDSSDILIGDPSLPSIFPDLLRQSCLIPALSSYLRNDSVLDITRHIPLYRSILQLLRAISISTQLMTLLRPTTSENSDFSIASLLANMKHCVDTYAKRLKVNKKSNIKGQTQKVTVNIDDGDDEGLALLIPDIQETAHLVQKATDTLSSSSSSVSDGNNGATSNSQSSDNITETNASNSKGKCLNLENPSQLSKSIEQRYMEVMKKLQFDTYEMITESENGYRFVVSHHFENNVRMAGDRGHPARMKRLAQETVTISTSLPLSYSSSVFVRCDTDRLDIMKVLITGPADTPYANGCFEFDVYFPPDYPSSPMLINLETTGRHSVRFNPNLYNDGKVCLSVLNTWHGRPEEKWNAQTSSFLQVLVSIQSLILVPEPYFNEPGFERSRGSASGTHCSQEYNSNIYQACVRWAMLEQIRNPSPCFKEVIHTHFWLKRHEICAQIENWLEELNKPQFNEKTGRQISFNAMVLRRQYRQLREELAKLKPPEGLELEELKLPPFKAALSSDKDTATTSTATTESGEEVATTSTPTTMTVESVENAAINKIETIIDSGSTELTTTITPMPLIDTISTSQSSVTTMSQDDASPPISDTLETVEQKEQEDQEQNEHSNPLQFDEIQIDEYPDSTDVIPLISNYWKPHNNMD